jgi:hypothetical protein
MKSLHQEKRPNFPLNAVGVTASSASRHLFGFVLVPFTDPRGAFGPWGIARGRPVDRLFPKPTYDGSPRLVGTYGWRFVGGGGAGIYRRGPHARRKGTRNEDERIALDHQRRGSRSHVAPAVNMIAMARRLMVHNPIGEVTAFRRNK